MFMMQIDPPLSHGLMDWFFLRPLNAVFSFDARLL